MGRSDSKTASKDSAVRSERSEREPRDATRSVLKAVSSNRFHEGSEPRSRSVAIGRVYGSETPIRGMAILVAYDGSAPAQKAVEHAFTTYPDEEIVLLRVIEAADGSTGAGIMAAQ